MIKALLALIRKVVTMDRSRRFKRKGFTIIELMIALAIVAIILALAYPSYTQYVRKGKRGDAQQALMNWSVNQEIWRANHTAYASTSDIPAPNLDNYNLSTSGTPNATTYTLQAVAQGDQAKDKARDGTSCATLTLNQAGQKTPAVCWD